MKLYRTEDFSGQEERDPIDVLTFETCELLNSDPIEELQSRFLMDDGELFDMSKECLRMVDENGAAENEQFFRDFFEQAIDHIRKVTGKDIRYVLWLAEMDSVKYNYGFGLKRITVDEYNVDDGVVLDDLGYDGTLYGFETEVFPVSSMTVETEAV